VALHCAIHNLQQELTYPIEKLLKSNQHHRHSHKEILGKFICGNAGHCKDVIKMNRNTRYQVPQSRKTKCIMAVFRQFMHDEMQHKVTKQTVII